jgi:uncharacterized protein with NAD-binding domain and iron-sulfur cluster
MSQQPSAIILGTGIAGLVAGYELGRRGVRVTLLDAAPVAGGRTTSYTDARGRAVDTGLHVVADHYVNLIEVLASLSVSRRLRWVGQHTYLRAGQPPMEWYFSPHAPPLHLLRPMREAPLSLGARLRLGGVGLRLLSYSQSDLAELDDLTYGAWHRRHGLGDGFALELAEAAADAATFLTVEEAAARPVLSWLKYLLRNQHAGDVGLFQGTLAECLVDPLLRAIEGQGGQVRLGTAVRGFSLSPDGRRVEGVWTAPAREGGPVHRADGAVEADDQHRELLRGDYIISAMNIQSLRAVLPAPAARAAGLTDAMRLTTTPAMSLIVWFDRPITPVPPGAPLTTGCAMRDFVDMATLGRQPGGAPGAVYQFVITRAKSRFEDPDQVVVDDVVRDLKAVWPAARPAQVVDYALSRIGAAMFAALPGAHRLRPAPQTQLSNLVLAGDWIRHDLNASMEGAALSGRMAADAVLRACGQPGVVIRVPPDPTVVPALRRLRQRVTAQRGGIHAG